MWFGENGDYQSWTPSTTYGKFMRKIEWPIIVVKGLSSYGAFGAIITIPLTEALVDKYRKDGFWGCFKNFKRKTPE